MKLKWLFINRFQMILLIGYIVVASIGDQTMSNVLSPLLLFTTVYILKGTRPKGSASLYWRMMMYLVLSWAIVDTIWFVDYYVLRGNPEERDLYSILYLIPNLILSINCAIYFYQNLKKWHFIQTISDFILVVLVLFLTVRFSLINYLSADYLSILEFSTSVLYILTDIFILSLMIAMAQTKKSGRFNIGVLFLLAGIFLFPISDLLYSYMLYYDFYVANNISDILFMISLSLLGYASAAIYYIKIKEDRLDETGGFEPRYAKGYHIKWILIVPIAFLILGYVDLVVVLKSFVLLGLHRFVSHYFSKVKEVEILLEREKKYNDYLEDRVAERTAELEKSNQNLNYLANMDTLCDLPNRRYFLRQVETLVNNKTQFLCFYLDIDRFKLINDIHGHEMGDRVIEALANNFKTNKPDEVTVCRIGGDEFGVICQCKGIDGSQPVSENILKVVRTPIEIDQYLFTLDASVGVSKYPEDTERFSQLLRYADIAMLQAKKLNSGEKIVFYKSNLSEMLERSNEIELMLKNADYEQEFELYYQPQIEIGSEKLIGAEALLRWHNPIIGQISPAEFIPIAEQSDVILSIGKWVLKKGMEQLVTWNETYDPNFKLGINISPVQFDSIDFFSYIVTLIDATTVDASNLDFEITENSAMNSNVTMEEIFTALYGLGVHISIDDFGTGYSSLSYIKRFDIDRIKIAKELIDNIHTDHVDRLIIKAITMMAKGMGLLTIAEGVESYDQLEYLKSIGCDEVQGYYYSKPLSKSDFETKYFKPQKINNELKNT